MPLVSPLALSSKAARLLLLLGAPIVLLPGYAHVKTGVDNTCYYILTVLTYYVVFNWLALN